MIEVKGKCNISAKIILDSVSAVTGDRMVTMEIEYPRIILSELNTHRMLSKNSASSRAIPFDKMVENLKGIPVRFGQANKGMQDKGEDFDAVVNYQIPCPITGIPQGGVSISATKSWELAKRDAIKHSTALYKAGLHKQIYNRVTEPFQMMKTVISGTEWANFFWLRCDEAADPSLQELANCMKKAYDMSTPQVLQAGEYHLPYVDTDFVEINGVRKQLFFLTNDGSYNLSDNISLEDAIKVSCARACAVSFRNTDYGIEKSKEVYERLIGDERKHGSATEHAAQVMEPCIEFSGKGTGVLVNLPSYPPSWQEGISHVDRHGNLWSGNIRGFIQFRKTIEGENHDSI